MAGQPSYFNSPEEMQASIEEYFKEPPKKKTFVKDMGEIEIPFVSMSGLALHLGFCSRQSLYDYEKRPEYSYTIKKARTLIENEYEFQLQKGNTTGAIFALKQFGWTDKIDQKLTGKLDTSSMSDEELDRLIAEKLKKLDE